jgi:Flp pilus assembly pilin Flp
MHVARSVWERASMMMELQLNIMGVKTRDERGAVSTEMAVVIAAMVAIAVAAGAIFMAKAQSNAENIPDTVTPP